VGEQPDSSTTGSRLTGGGIERISSSRQQEIEQQQVGRVLAKRRHGLGAVERRPHLVAFAAKGAPHDLTEIAIVVDVENGGRHRLDPPGLSGLRYRPYGCPP
jgi:hypothetical protein